MRLWLLTVKNLLLLLLAHIVQGLFQLWQCYELAVAKSGYLLASGESRYLTSFLLRLSHYELASIKAMIVTHVPTNHHDKLTVVQGVVFFQ